METFLSCGVPDFIAEDTILKAAFLRQERSTDSGLLVGLEFVGDLTRETDE